MTEMFTLLNTPDDPAHDAMVEKKSEFIGIPSRGMWPMRRSAAGRTAACPSG